MAKTPKVKKGRPVSTHSRAARRAESPSLNLDKSITEAKTPETGNYKPSVLGAQNAGIKKKKGKQLTRAQRLRQQKGVERADANFDKLEKKVADSKAKGREVNNRRADWEQLNAKVSRQTEPVGKVDKKEIDALVDAIEDDGAYERRAEQAAPIVTEAVVEDVELTTVAPDVPVVPAGSTDGGHIPAEEEDEIL